MIIGFVLIYNKAEEHMIVSTPDNVLPSVLNEHECKRSVSLASATKQNLSGSVSGAELSYDLRLIYSCKSYQYILYVKSYW